MPYLVTGTRERIHPPQTSGDSVAGDEVDPIGPGWIALTSEPLEDGSVRVIYGRLPDGGPVAQSIDERAVPTGRGGAELDQRIRAAVMVSVIILLVCAGVMLLAFPH